MAATKPKTGQRQYELAYSSIIIIGYCHLAGCYGLYTMCLTKAKWMTLLLTSVTYAAATVGVVVGAHKLWAHRSFRAAGPLEVALMLGHTIAFQFTAYHWVRLHRAHHLYSDSPRDPHDASRGLFYSHLGWLMVRRPGGELPAGTMDDVRRNPVLAFQRRHAIWLLPTMAFVLPTVIPLLWGEDISTSWHLNILRFLVNLHSASTVNSVSHTWGYRPYDNRLKAFQSWPIVLLTWGEGYHNFHHAFPHDYRASEKGLPNVMAGFVDVCAKVGLASGLREASEESVRMRRALRGDGSL